MCPSYFKICWFCPCFSTVCRLYPHHFSHTVNFVLIILSWGKKARLTLLSISPYYFTNSHFHPMSLFCVLFQSLFALSLLLRSLQNKHKNKVPVLFPPSPSGHHLLSYCLFWAQPTSSVVSIMISSTHSHIHCSELNRPSPSPVLPDLMLLWAEPEVNMEQIRQVTLQELGSNIVVCDASLQVMTNGRPFHGLQCSIFHHVICTMATEKEALKYACLDLHQN